MKHSEISWAIESGSALAHSPIPKGDADRLATHLTMVLERGSSINLTSITDPDEAVWVHVLDSIAAAPVVAEAPAGPMLDIGSGAGYPAIPLALATGRPVTMLESIGKKADFLSEVVAALGIDCTVAAERAEVWALEHRDSYAVVTARALASLASLVELAAPLLRPDGWLVALKGRADEAELSRGAEVAAMIGMSEPVVRRLVVPGADERIAVVVARQGPLARPLPRAIGRAQKRPLA